MLPLLFLLGSAPLLVRGQAQTSAICAAEFAWMTNSKGSSPCLVAAQLDSVCNNGNWIIPRLDASVHYQNPTLANGTVSLCTCSWASYNLISACIACQGFPEQTPFWGDYTSGCAGQLSKNYFPSNITLPDNVAIPFWASQDPTKWTNQKFNTPDAKQIQQAGKPDLGSPTTSTPTKKKSSPTGAIVGGVVGGLVVIGIAIAVALYILRRQRKTVPVDPNVTEGGRPPHMRSTSDTTMNSAVKSMPYTSFAPSTSMSTPHRSDTIRTHNTSITMPFTASPSPPPVHGSSANTRTEDMVTPFTLPPTIDNTDRKRSSGGFPVFDSPSAPPPHVNALSMLSYPQTPSQRNRSRYNPPAYSESSPDQGSGTGTPPPRHRGRQESSDNLSLNSSGHATTNRNPSVGHSHANSGSSMYVPQQAPFGVANSSIPTTSSDITMPEGYGHHVGQATSLQRRPTQDSFTGGDIA